MDTALWTRFVAVGDSFTEGLDDLLPDGTPRGWADLVAAALASRTPGFRYANLAVRGRTLDPVVDEQVPAALALGPDLVSFAAGGNDVLRPRFDLAELGARLDGAVARLGAAGATVVLFAGFDPSPRLPLGRLLAARADAYNGLIRAAAVRHGAVLVDLWRLPALADPRAWSADRLHLSAVGHAAVAQAVLSALGQDAAVAGEEAAAAALGARSRRQAVGEELSWTWHHLLPWVGRRLRGRSAGDGRPAKRPSLELVDAPGDAEGVR
jgi:lysophospholipase L1-like esterase